MDTVISTSISVGNAVNRICNLLAGIAFSKVLMFCSWSDTDNATTCVSIDFVMLTLHEQASKLVQDENMLRCQGSLLAGALQQNCLPESTSDRSIEHTDKDTMQVHMPPAQWSWLPQAKLK